MVGIDIVEVSRIGDALYRYGERFLKKVFTDEEIDYSMGRKRSIESLAGRFAAKEAFMKAFGRRLPWREIKVVNIMERPSIEYKGKRYGGVSISHERSYAVSVVVIGEEG
ncbi:MAG: holo-ACP synthase [Syntrophorhabdaceae bacterium]|nr:holo-ACP synthase [Syntrophorhabdaceae bacterium]